MHRVGTLKYIHENIRYQNGASTRYSLKFAIASKIIQPFAVNAYDRGCLVVLVNYSVSQSTRRSTLGR